MKRTLIILVAIVLAVVFAASLATAAERRTRDLVFEDEENLAQDSGIANPQVVAIRTSLELTRAGQTEMVLPTHAFATGDKVKFIYTTNIDCYVYWLTEGTTGLMTLILPENFGTDDRYQVVGNLTRVEAETLVVGYNFDLHTNELNAERVPNPNAGTQHRFVAYRLKGQANKPVSMTGAPVQPDENNLPVDE